jgi:uncharacterized protein involved in outer membrane biogenesis
MKTLLKILAVIVLLGVMAGVGGYFYLNHYLQSPTFKQMVLDGAKQALGAEVKIQDLNVSVFSGISLKGVTIANPTGFDGQLLTAQAFVLRYRLLPLLRRRVVIEQLSLEQPKIVMCRNDKGDWNYDKLGGPASSTPTPATGGSSLPGGINLTLSKLALTDGSVSMLGVSNKPLVQVEGINFSSAVDLTGGALTGNGQAKIGLLNIAQSLLLRQVGAPVSLSSQEVKLAPVSGQLAGGNVSGELGVKLAGGFKYGADLQIKDSDVATLLKEAGTKQILTGKLQANAKVSGTGGLATMTGSGKAEVADGLFVDVPLLKLIGTLLQIEELKQLKFDKCLLEFTIADNVMQTPVIKISAAKVELTGHGNIQLSDYSLNHEFTLALAKDLLSRLPQEVRDALTQRADGYYTLSFKVTGPYDSPKTDLGTKLVQDAAKQLLKKFLK